MNKNVEDFNFYRGDTYIRNITLKNVTVDIDEIYFTVRSTDKAKVYIQKKLGKGIEVVSKEDDEEYEGDTYKIVLTIEATDTDNMLTDFEYFYDLEIISGKCKKTILEGTVLLETDYTRTRNEV